jgi:hypothetical protein
MNWDAIIAVSEIVGVIAIIASLVYVGIQIRQSASFARASVINDTSMAWTNASALLASDAELADIYLRGIDNETLTPVETVRLEALIDIYMTNLENIDHQYQSNLYFEEDDDKDVVDFLAPIYRPLLTSNVGKRWWSTIAPVTHTPSYFEKLDRIMKAWQEEKNE